MRDFDQFAQVLNWCPGCGDYAIQVALKKALIEENRKPKDTLLCFDIGCNGNGADKVGAYTIHGLHGRVLPLSVGAKIANPNLTVVASAGDGATFSEGINHLIHAIRNDYPIVFLVHDNHNYALTTGQASATTEKGCSMNGSPYGVTTDALRPLDLVLSLNPSFMAQTLSADIPHMTKTIQKALNHKGFAFVEILQTCPTYNKKADDAWYRENVWDTEADSSYDRFDISYAKKALENDHKKKPIGVLYQNQKKQEFFEALGIKTPRNHTRGIQPVDISPFYS